MKKFAVRVFCNKHHTYAQLNIDATQKSKEDNKSIENNISVGEALKESFPKLFEKELND